MPFPVIRCCYDMYCTYGLNVFFSHHTCTLPLSIPSSLLSLLPFSHLSDYRGLQAVVGAEV